MWACLTLIARVSGEACCRLAPLRVAHGTGLRRLQGISFSSAGSLCLRVKPVLGRGWWSVKGGRRPAKRTLDAEGQNILSLWLNRHSVRFNHGDACAWLALKRLEHRCHARDIPEEARQLASHAHHGNIGMFAACGKFAEAAAQAQFASQARSTTGLGTCSWRTWMMRLTLAG